MCIGKEEIIMIKDKNIFNGATAITVGGNKLRVLTTPHHISHSEIPDDLNIYSLIKKGKNHYMVDNMDSTNTEDFEMSMISHIELALGSDIELEHCDMLYGPHVNMSIQEYYVETVGIMKLYVMMPTEDVALEEIIKRLNAAWRCFAIAYGRSIDDIEILNRVDEIDPYDVESNFENEVDRSIYRLTKKLRIMGRATHILDMSRSYGIMLRNPCCVEREVCEKYNLNRIEVGLINDAVKKIQKQNDDLAIIMGKTDVVGTPTRPRFGDIYTPYHTPGLNDGDYDG